MLNRQGAHLAYKVEVRFEFQRDEHVQLGPVQQVCKVRLDIFEWPQEVFCWPNIVQEFNNRFMLAVLRCELAGNLEAGTRHQKPVTFHQRFDPSNRDVPHKRLKCNMRQKALLQYL
jgi:hypothetical protein